MTGVMYKQFSVTIAVSVLISALVALTLTPSLCALIIKRRTKKEEPHGFFKWFDDFFQKITDIYLAVVRFFLNNRKTAVLGYTAIIASIIWMFKLIPGGLVPMEDMGSLLMAYDMPGGRLLAANRKNDRRGLQTVVGEPQCREFNDG